jgi:hypothetical protein
VKADNLGSSVGIASISIVGHIRELAWLVQIVELQLPLSHEESALILIATLSIFMLQQRADELK